MQFNLKTMLPITTTASVVLVNILSLLTVANAADATYQVEDIVRSGTPASGFLTSVDVELNRCILMRTKKFSRRCGTSFDASKIVTETQVIDLSKYRLPVYDEINKVIVFDADDKATLDDRDAKSHRLKTTCSGYAELETNAPFYIERRTGEPDIALQENLKSLTNYSLKICRHGEK